MPEMFSNSDFFVCHLINKIIFILIFFKYPRHMYKTIFLDTCLGCNLCPEVFRSLKVCYKKNAFISLLH